MFLLPINSDEINEVTTSVVIIIKSNIYMAMLMVEFHFLSVRIDIRNGKVDESTDLLI